MLEYTGPAANNNCVIKRKNLFEQIFGGMKGLSSKVTRTTLFQFVACKTIIIETNTSASKTKGVSVCTSIL